MEKIKELYAYRQMIFSLVQRELRGRYKGSVLGFLWTFINPLLQLIVYTIVFSVIMRNGIEKYYIFLFVALVPWTLISSALVNGSTCILSSSDMIKKIYFPREVLPIACVTSNFVNMLFCFIIVFAVLFISGVGISIKAVVFLPLIMGLEYLLSLGFTLIVSAGTVYFKDLEHIVTVLLMAWIYGTPIMYSMSIIPENIKWIFKANPMTSIIEAFHNILYWKVLPEVHDIVYALVFGIILVIVGELIFAKLDDNFAEEL